MMGAAMIQAAKGKQREAEPGRRPLQGSGNDILRGHKPWPFNQRALARGLTATPKNF